MTQRELFHLAPFRDDQPLKDHPFYQWLLENEDEELNDRGKDKISDYLAQLGFDIKRHRLDDGQLRTLQYAWQTYGDLWMPTREPQRLDDLFFPRETKTRKTYWLRGRGDVVLSTKVVEMIEKAAPIYPLDPIHYYFEVVNHTLFIKYQTIIGSRRLCPIKEADHAHHQ